MEFFSRIFIKNTPFKIQWILVFVFIVTMGYAFYARIPPVVDARAYDKIAVNLVAGNGYREDLTKPILADLSIVRAGPGYEFFLFGIYTLFGHRYEPVWLIQAGLHTVSAWFLFLIARRWFGVEKKGYDIGLWAAGLFGCWPELIEMSAMLMTETLYLFFSIVCVWLFFELWVPKVSLSRVVLAGVIIGIALLTRPPIALFIPIFLVSFWYKKDWRGASFFCCAILVPLLPWIVRNALVYHQFIPTTRIADYNLWLGNTLTSNGGQFTASYNPLDAYLNTDGAKTLHAHVRNMFGQFVVQHPLVFMKLCFLRVIRFFSLIRPMGFWFYQSGLRQALMVAASGIWIAMLFFLGSVGLRQIWQGRKVQDRLVVLFAMTVPLPLFITVVESRYRLGVYPFLALAAGYVLVAKQYQSWRSWLCQPIVYTTGLFFVGVSCFDFWYFLPTVWEHLGRFF